MWLGGRHVPLTFGCLLASAQPKQPCNLTWADLGWEPGAKVDVETGGAV